MCCPCHHRPVGRHEGVHRCAELPEKLLWDRDEGAMICEHGHQHLLGYVGPAEEAEPESGPAGYAGMQPLEDVCVEGLCCSAGICAERDAKVSDRRASRTEGDACGLVWANKVLERANAHANRLVALHYDCTRTDCLCLA